MLKLTISTSVWSAQHQIAGRNIHNWVRCLRNLELSNKLSRKKLKISNWLCPGSNLELNKTTIHFKHVNLGAVYKLRNVILETFWRSTVYALGPIPWCNTPSNPLPLLRYVIYQQPHKANPMPQKKCQLKWTPDFALQQYHLKTAFFAVTLVAPVKIHKKIIVWIPSI